MDRRSFLRLMLASAAAEAIDFEKLLWVPRAIITVPAWGTVGAIDRSSYAFWRNNLGQIVAEEWEKQMALLPTDNVFDAYWLAKNL